MTFIIAISMGLKFEREKHKKEGRYRMSSIISNSDGFEQENMGEYMEMVLLVFGSNKTWFETLMRVLTSM